MSQAAGGVKKMNTDKIIFLLSLFMCSYWVSGHLINIYRFALVGAVFEMLWLPMLAALVILPVLSFVFWLKKKFAARSLCGYALLISISTILVQIFYK